MDSISNSNFLRDVNGVAKLRAILPVFPGLRCHAIEKSALTGVVGENPNVTEVHAKSAISSVPLNCRKSTLSRKEGSVFAVKSERTS